MSYFVYIVECIDKSYYTGINWNLSKRVSEHNNGLSISTKSKLPVRLVYWERFESKVGAAKREKVIKGWNRGKKKILVSSLR